MESSEEGTVVGTVVRSEQSQAGKKDITASTLSVQEKMALLEESDCVLS